MNKKKIFLIPLVLGASLGMSVAVLNSAAPEVAVKAEGEATPVTYSDLGSYGWNNKESGSSLITLIRVSGAINGGVTSAVDYARAGYDFGEKVTFDGEVIKNLSYVHCDFSTLGANGLAFYFTKSKVDLTKRHVLHIPEGTVFIDVSLPELTLTMEDSIWYVGQYGDPNVLLKGFPSDEWNNKVSGSLSSNLITFSPNFIDEADKSYTNQYTPYISMNSLTAKGITIDGVDVWSGRGSVSGVTCQTSQGGGHMYFTYNAGMQQEGSILHIERGTPFGKAFLPEVKAVYHSGKWEFVNTGLTGEPDNYIKDIHSSWNNYAADGLWGLPSGYKATILVTSKPIVPEGGSIGLSNVNPSLNFMDSVTLNGKKLNSFDSNVNIHVNEGLTANLEHAVLVVPASESYEGAVLEIPNGMTFGITNMGKTTLKLTNGKWGNATKDAVTLTGVGTNPYWNNSDAGNNIVRTIFTFAGTPLYDYSPSSDSNLYAGICESIQINGRTLKEINSSIANSVKVAYFPAFTGTQTSFRIELSRDVFSGSDFYDIHIDEGTFIGNGYVEEVGGFCVANASASTGVTGWLFANLSQVNALVDSLHMEGSTEGQCVSLYAAAKAAYLGLSSDTEKFYFQRVHADAYARLSAWARANGDVLVNNQISSANASFNLISVDDADIPNILTIMAVVAGLSFAALVIVKKKKHE